MTLLIIMFFKTQSMKLNWKKILLYVVRIVELIVTGAAGGTIAGNF